MNKILTSLDNWFKHLSYQRKFGVITAIFLLPIIAFLPLINNEMSRIRRYGSDELSGTFYIRSLWKLANDLELHQAVSQEFFGGNIERDELDNVQAIIDDDFESLDYVEANELNTKPYQIETDSFSTQWLAIKEETQSGAPTELDSKHEKLYNAILSLIYRVADNSHLVLDPDLDTYYMADTVIVVMTENQRIVMDIYLASNSMTADGELTQIETERLNILLEALEKNQNKLDDNIRVAIANNSRVDMDQVISAPLVTYQTGMAAFAEYIQSKMLDGGFQGESVETTRKENLAQYQKINKANELFYMAASESLQAGVSARVNALILRFYPTALIVLASIAGAFLLGQSLMDSISRPLVQLTLTSQQLASGDLSARVKAEGSDELVKVANALNQMASDLEADRTTRMQRASELEIANRINERRAQNLQSINEISRLITSEQKLDILLPLITRLVSDKFNFYHVGIFLVDDNRLFAVLQAANSEGGQRMLHRGHRLELGTGIVGTVVVTGQPRIAMDVGADAVYFDNPDLPTTRSEMALPLKVRGETIGALDVQSMHAGAFTEEDASLLGILADQVATVIDNARLFTKMQQALDEVQALYNRYLQKEWKALHHKTQNVGYLKTVNGGKPLEAPIESEDILHAVRTGQTLISRANGGDADPIVVVPIKLRGRTIGVLNIKAASREREWTRDELNLIQSVTDRLALALENARLFEETSRRAEREKLVSEISGKIRSVNNPQAMIQTAVDELRSVLGASRVQVIPQALPDSDTTND